MQVKQDSKYLPVTKKKGVVTFTKDKMNFYSRNRIIKNLIILSIGFLFTFTAHDALGMLQSTMNREQGIGVAGQAIIYGLFCISALLFPKYVITRFGCKFSLVISLFCYVPYLATNYYPHWALVIPVCILEGLAASMLWGSQCTYLNELASLYCRYPASSSNDENTSDNSTTDRKKSVEERCSMPKLDEQSSKEDKQPKSISSTKLATIDLHTDIIKKGRTEFQQSNIESITARFFGFHGLAYLSSHVWSNVMSYYVLLEDDDQKNVSLSINCTCGPDFCNVNSKCFEHNIEEPSTEIRYILTSICVGLNIVAALIVTLFLDPLKPGRKEVPFSLELLMATCKLTKKRKQQLLIPLSFYIGMFQGFYSGDFTKSYIGCAWGTYHVGLVSICYGSTSALSSTVSGLFVKRFGRVIVFLVAEVVNVAAIVFLLLWNPEATDPLMFFLAAGLYGIAVGAFWSQLRAYYGVIFRGEEEVAFAGFYLWYSLGTCLSFAYSSYFCTFAKVYALLGVSTVGILGYFISEYLYFPKKIKK